MRPPHPLPAALAVLLFAGAAVAQDAAGLRPTPPSHVPPLLSEQQVGRAVATLDGIVEDAMARSGVPGIAVAVVYRDRTVYLRGFGVREAGQPEPVDADTVFQLASLSKPIASTIVAGVVGRGLIGWHDPVRSHLPSFALSDPYVTANATVADLLSHRAGLFTSAGDLLEDLGHDRPHIVARLRHQPLDAFRARYNYSNFGYTLGAEAAAAATGTTWEDLADAVLFEPLGMSRSSFRHDDFRSRKNRARLHVRDGGRWVARHERDADPQAPAGGASGSIDDLARYLRLQLGGGGIDGRILIDAAALATTHSPHVVSGPARSPLGRAGFYGLGWNVGYDDSGRLEISHAGAFYLGASTYAALIPGEQLGIAVLTNGEPVGVAEGIARNFFDISEGGAARVDWFGLFGSIYDAMRAGEAAPFAYAAAPEDARPPRALAGYAGRFHSDYYGTAVVTLEGEGLTMAMGPEAGRVSWDLVPHDSDTFTFRPVGENAVPRAGVTFRRDPQGAVSGLVIDFYDRTGLGTFALRSPR